MQMLYQLSYARPITISTFTFHSPLANHNWKLFITVCNKVAKVMFLQVCVCPQEGYLVQGDLLWGGCLVQGGLLPGGCLVLGGHLLPGGCLVWREVGIPACTEQNPLGETATAADGMHPTGMHFCFECFYVRTKMGKFVPETCY